jgi:hypothetical protein
MRRIYIAGPMTGIDHFNYPAFNAEAARLRALGYHVENPAENNAAECGTWAGYMRNALRQMLTCDAVALLPGWMGSRGARIEHRLAIDLGMQARPVDEYTEATQFAA